MFIQVHSINVKAITSQQGLVSFLMDSSELKVGLHSSLLSPLLLLDSLYQTPRTSFPSKTYLKRLEV